MSALIPPKHDLSGGNASAASFAMSKTTFVTLRSRCLFAAGNQRRSNPSNSFGSYIGLPRLLLSLLINTASEKNLAWLACRRRCREQSQRFSRWTRVHRGAGPAAGSPFNADSQRKKNIAAPEAIAGIEQIPSPAAMHAVFVNPTTKAETVRRQPGCPSNDPN